MGSPDAYKSVNLKEVLDGSSLRLPSITPTNKGFTINNLSLPYEWADSTTPDKPLGRDLSQHFNFTLRRLGIAEEGFIEIDREHDIVTRAGVATLPLSTLSLSNMSPEGKYVAENLRNLRIATALQNVIARTILAMTTQQGSTFEPVFIEKGKGFYYEGRAVPKRWFKDGAPINDEGYQEEFAEGIKDMLSKYKKILGVSPEFFWPRFNSQGLLTEFHLDAGGVWATLEEQGAWQGSYSTHNVDFLGQAVAGQLIFATFVNEQLQSE